MFSISKTKENCFLNEKYSVEKALLRPISNESNETLHENIILD